MNLRAFARSIAKNLGSEVGGQMTRTMVAATDISAAQIGTTGRSGDRRGWRETGYRLRKDSTSRPINPLRVMSMCVVPGRTASWP
jgi:hypothetical protein